jgi:hypothetical protein
MQGQSKEYVYVDSSLLYPGSADSAAVAEPPAEDDQYEDTDIAVNYAADTALQNNELALSRDSIRLLKNAKQFAYAKVMDSLLKDLQKQQADTNQLKAEEPSAFAAFLSSGITKFIFWTLAIFFVVFIIYKLFFTQGFLQRQSARIPVKLLKEEAEDTKGAVDYERQIGLAVSNKNFRLATRYLYLQSIQKLMAAGLISFAADKTNSQYLYELSGKPYKEEFVSLTLNYEYVWYGEFLIDETAYIKLQQRFKQFNTQFKNN